MWYLFNYRFIISSWSSIVRFCLAACHVWSVCAAMLYIVISLICGSMNSMFYNDAMRCLRLLCKLTLSVHSFCAGFKAMRNTEKGSWFVRFFVYVCSSEAHYNDLTRIMTKVLNASLNLQSLWDLHRSVNSFLNCVSAHRPALCQMWLFAAWYFHCKETIQDKYSFSGHQDILSWQLLWNVGAVLYTVGAPAYKTLSVYTVSQKKFPPLNSL